MICWAPRGITQYFGAGQREPCSRLTKRTPPGDQKSGTFVARRRRLRHVAARSVKSAVGPDQASITITTHTRRGKTVSGPWSDRLSLVVEAPTGQGAEERAYGAIKREHADRGSSRPCCTLFEQS